jgi:hypothetical protein
LNGVISTYGGGFGDCWAAASFLAAQARTRRVLVSKIDPRVMEIIQFLELSGSIEEVDALADTVIMSPEYEEVFHAREGYRPKQIVPWRTLFALKYVETRVKWKPRSSNVVYQLMSSQHRTSCDPTAINAFRECVDSLNRTATPIGLPMSLASIILETSRSSLFVGIDSGMAHLCHSIGIPMVLIRNQLPIGYLQVTHAGKKFREYPNMAAVLMSLPRLLLGS